MNNLTPNINLFNERIKNLNQTNARSFILPAREARDLHAEIFQLLTDYNALMLSVINITTRNQNGGEF
jgi:hypothetical protein